MFQGHELDKEHLGLPPCGGSGLKYGNLYNRVRKLNGLPPCGGSGLKCYYGYGDFELYRLPPCGGSGLKFGESA